MKVQSTLLLLTGASALVQGLNIGKRDEGGDLVVRAAQAPAPQPCVEVEGPDNCPDPYDPNDPPGPDGPKGPKGEKGPKGPGKGKDRSPPPPHEGGTPPPPPRDGAAPPPPPHDPNCVEVDGPGRGGRDGDRDYDGVPNWEDTTDDRPRRADGTPLPPHCWDNPPPLREGEPPRPVCTDEDRNGRGTSAAAATAPPPPDPNCVEVDGPDNCPDRDDYDGPGRGGRDGDRDYDGVPNWEDTTDDRPRRADGSPLPPHCWDNPPPLREGEPPRPVCTDEDRNGRSGSRSGYIGTTGTGGTAPVANSNANTGTTPSGDRVGATDSYRQDSSVRQVDHNAAGRNSIPVTLGGVAGLAIAFAAFM